MATRSTIRKPTTAKRRFTAALGLNQREVGALKRRLSRTLEVPVPSRAHGKMLSRLTSNLVPPDSSESYAKLKAHLLASLSTPVRVPTRKPARR